MALIIRPLTLAKLNAAVTLLHRHHKPVQGHRFSLGAYTPDGTLVGACSVGRPVAREIEQYYVAEVTRLVTDGTKNTCSALYAAAARACEAMGFDSIQTYILATEKGKSVEAAGWKKDGIVRGRDWNNGPRKGTRRSDQPMGDKVRYVKKFKRKSALYREKKVNCNNL